MSTQVRDPFLAVTLTGTGATYYRLSHTDINTAEWIVLPTPETNGDYIVPYTLPNTPANYSLSAQLKNSIHQSTVVATVVNLLSNIVNTVSLLRNKLRIAQVYGNNVTPDTIPDGIKCFYCWLSLYNAGTTAIDLSTVAIWTRYENCTSVLDQEKGTYTNTPSGTLSDWVKVSLSGTIQPGKYFLIKGKRPTTIVAEETLVPCIDFTTFVPDLDKSADLFISSKFCNLFLADASLVTPPTDIFASGALSSNFIDLYGITSIASDGSETYMNPQAIVAFGSGNSKQQVKTLIDPTKEAADNSLDYSSTSIKSITTTSILTSPAKPRNSTYA